jgi:hypothetical protein
MASYIAALSFGFGSVANAFSNTFSYSHVHVPKLEPSLPPLLLLASSTAMADLTQNERGKIENKYRASWDSGREGSEGGFYGIAAAG